jgi:TusA-related sulfurtransferase
MSERKISVSQPLELDLSGFRRRLPRAAIAWHVGQLGVDDNLTIILDPAADSGSVVEALRSCGGEFVRTEIGERGQLLTVRWSRVRSITRELDMRGRRCPVPVIEARRQLRGMSSGEVLKMFADCTGAPAEVDTWAANSANVALLDTWSQGPDHVFLIGSM